MKDIHEGLGILLKYKPDGSCDAEHDEIFAEGPEPEAMAPEDAARLDDLGWRWDGSLGSWCKFT